MTQTLQEQINELISEIEVGLLKEHIHTGVPQVALEYQSKLSAYLSSSYGQVEILDTREAKYFVNTRKDYKSDNACRKSWENTHDGIAQKFWENRVERLQVLIRALEKIYYFGRDEARQKDLK